jgi:hypothetical protein
MMNLPGVMGCFFATSKAHHTRLVQHDFHGSAVSGKYPVGQFFRHPII